ncbi:MAG TPA: hypothetical protein VNQ79_05280 [Blastocatellia bacterium]|nr:hypothetical protein [Blastocatellia bacterium]
MTAFDHIWHWHPKPPLRPIDRKGQRCRVNRRGALNSIEVEFEDGFRVICSRYAVRKTEQRNNVVQAS